MEYVLTQFASTESTSDGGIFGALGIDITMLVLQAIAFLILVVLLGKFVYPVLIKAVDDRQEKIEESVKAAQAAEEKAESAQENIAALLKEARKEAKEIVTTAKDEATAMVEASDKKAKQRSEKIVADAHEQIEKDVIAARKALHNDTIELVALATEKVIGKTMSSNVDDKVIAAAVKEAN
ncbi:F0F1 ATP synthase subunit B [Candidatus Saccharibacteria bacterium]|nr:F0F1 ATP synthase subunit B [Candidatus Saccharibacteria bacterium]